MTCADGRTYVGDFVDGLWSGEGIATWPNGDRYEGQLKGDMANGKGTMTYADGTTYVGDWVAGLRSGEGITTAPDGERYEKGYSQMVFSRLC